MKSGLWLGTALLAIGTTVGCGESPIAPVSPSESPFATEFTGLWNGTMVLSSASGGECVGADLRRSMAAGPQVNVGTVAISQQRSDVTAMVRSATTGLSCSYRGTASLAGYALSAESCGEPVLAQCSTGESRVLEPIGSTMTVTQSGGTTTGVVTTSYNIYSESTVVTQRSPVAGLTTQHQFTATRQ